MICYGKHYDYNGYGIDDRGNHRNDCIAIKRNGRLTHRYGYRTAASGNKRDHDRIYNLHLFAHSGNARRRFFKALDNHGNKRYQGSGKGDEKDGVRRCFSVGIATDSR